MGKSSGTQTVSQSPWGPTQGPLQFAISELDRLYGRPASSGRGFGMGRPFGGGQFGGGFSGSGGWPMSTGDPRSGSSSVSLMPFPQSQPTQAQAPTPVPSPVEEYGLVDPAAEELRRMIAGDYTSASHPGLDEAIRRAQGDVAGQFSGMGRYGSGAMTDALFTRAALPLRYQAYENERARQLAAIQAAPGFEMVPYQLYSARTAAPYEGIRNYLDLLNPIARGGSQQSSPIYKNPLSGALGGAALGAGIGSLTAGAGATGIAALGGWPFLLGGALLGGLAS